MSVIIYILFQLFIGISVYAQQPETPVCESITCPPLSTICMSSRRSMENVANVDVLITCMTSNGTITQNSESTIPNPTPQRKTDSTSFTILGLNTTKEKQQQVIAAIIEVVRKLIAGQPFPSSQYGFGGYPGSPGMQPPFVINLPPAQAPVITITNMGTPYGGSGSSSYNSFMNRNYCPNPPCMNNLPPSPPTSSAGSNPNLMPTSLDAIYERMAALRNCVADLERVVSDASAAVPPPTFGPTNNIAFPVTMPYNPNVNSNYGK